MARGGEFDIGFWMFNFSPQLRGTLTRGFLLTQRPLRTRREIKGFLSTAVAASIGVGGTRRFVGDCRLRFEDS